MKVASIVGARPQFIKCASVSRSLRKHGTEVLIHTGQHYDPNMSDVFFQELDIPKPDYHLGVGSGMHGAQTADMLRKVEEVLVSERPDWVLVYGDTNSTLAGALAAVKLHVPVGHVEAGLRSFNREMPEEINRIVVDHVSTLRFCPTSASLRQLAKENITSGVHLVGDVMYDALLYNKVLAEKRSDILGKLEITRDGFYLATVHRAENTDNQDRLTEIVNVLDAVGGERPVVWPIHPRTKKRLADLGEASPAKRRTHITFIEPVSYLDMLALEMNARAILTDSGGVQKEALWLQVPCITLRNETEWPETVELGWNTLAGTDRQAIARAVSKKRPAPCTMERLGGDGFASTKIAELLLAGSPH